MPNIINADNGVVSGSAGLKQSADSTGVLALQTNGTTAVTVSASQNVGIGTISPSGPLNVVSAASSLAIAINGRSADGVGAMYFYANNGSTQYSTITASATEFRLSSIPAAAVQTFYTNGAERVRIDSSGNVGIGTASPNSKMSIAYSSTSTSVLGTYANIPLLLQNTSSTDNNWTVIGVQDASGDFSSYIGTQNTSQASSTAIMAFATNGGSGATERMRIDSSGNVGIGTTNPSRSKLVIGATTPQISFTDTDGSSNIFDITRIAGPGLSFSSNGSEKMRLDSNGRLQLGTTSDPGGGAMMAIKGSGTTISTVSLYIINSSSVGNFLVYDNGAINTGTTSAGSPYVNTTGTAANAVLGSDGFLRRSTSSLKYKTDIQDAAHGLTDLLKLRSVTYKGKNDGDIIFGGLIAEEVDAAGLNEFVQYAADGSPDALAYGNMVSLCVKAIQEQQAIITTLTARITALEAQNADNPPQGETP
jgi:hypothetical protein